MAIVGMSGLVFPYTITLSKAGNATPGSANEFGDAGEVLVPPTYSPAPYEKGAEIRWLTQCDWSDYPGINVPIDRPQITRDVVARLSVGVLDVSWGRVWGHEARAVKLPGVVGYAVGLEINYENYGNDCSDPNDSIRGSFCQDVGSTGTAPTTCRLRWGSEGGQPSHYGLHVQSGALSGPLINSEDDFAITCQGQRIMWSTVVRALQKLRLV